MICFQFEFFLSLASYAHLSGYYFRSSHGSALWYAGKMYSAARLLRSPDDELEALEKLITLNAPGAVKIYFTRYQYLRDSLQTTRNNAKNQFAMIRYEVARSKADNISLQKENVEKKWQILIQWGVIVIITATAGFTVFWLRKRRQRLLREQQLKTSQKVHDLVANGLYHLMTRIQYESPHQELVLDDLEQLYEKSRNISYDQPEEAPANYHESIAGKRVINQQCRKFSSGAKLEGQFKIPGPTKPILFNLNPFLTKQMLFLPHGIRWYCLSVDRMSFCYIRGCHIIICKQRT